MTFAQYAALWDSIEQAGPKYRGDALGADFDPDLFMIERQRREQFLANFAYAVPTVEAVQKAVQFAAGPILEVGAGRGLWAYLIRLENGTIRPTDLHVKGRVMQTSNPYMGLQSGAAWLSVEQADAAQAAAHASEPTLMMVWPSYSDSWAGEALKKFTGQRLIYVGEKDGGCTGNDALHDELAAAWVLSSTVRIPQWVGMHDTMWLYQRR
jgi:hypothetical protein